MNAEEARPICVVDDDDAVRASAKLLLETAGYAVWDFPSAEALLENIATIDPACFLLDFQLGGMTGLELVERLRARGVQAPAIIVTANAHFFEERHKHVNVLAVLRKPVSATSLLDWIEKACSQV